MKNAMSRRHSRNTVHARHVNSQCGHWTIQTTVIKCILVLAILPNGNRARECETLNHSHGKYFIPGLKDSTQIIFQVCVDILFGTFARSSCIFVKSNTHTKKWSHWTNFVFSICSSQEFPLLCSISF